MATKPHVYQKVNQRKKTRPYPIYKTTPDHLQKLRFQYLGFWYRFCRLPASSRTVLLHQATMRKIIFWAAISCLLFLVGCRKDGDETIVAGKISFQDPQVGQRSMYVSLVGDDYKQLNNHHFEYLADTLIAEIMEKDTAGYLVREYLTSGSASLNGASYVAFADSTIYYYLRFEQDEIHIKNLHPRLTSRLFFFNTSVDESLPMQDFTDLQVEFKGWKTNIPYSTNLYKAFVVDYRQFDAVYDRLNVMIDNRPMKNRGAGHTHVYSAKHGLIRSCQYSWYTSKGFGWDLLPQPEL